MTSPVDFEAFDIPGARANFGNVFPYGLQVRRNGSCPTIADAAASLRILGESGKITELLNRHGAVLFRGIGHPSAETFSDLVSAAEEGGGGYPHEQIGLAGKRSPLAKFIYTANEDPPECRFYQHNEILSDRSVQKTILIKTAVLEIYSLPNKHSFLLREEGLKR